MKRLWVVLAVVCFVVTGSAAAFAQNNFHAPDHKTGNGIQEIYMVDNPDSFTPVKDFSEDATPWLYLKLAQPSTEASGDWWFWNKGNQNYALSFDTALLTSPWLMEESSNGDGSRNIWLTRTDITDFTAHDQWWHVNNVHSSCPNGGGSTKYHVTPEPASTALFILGAAAFGFGIFRRKSL